MTTRTFLETTDELRRVACAIAGYRPGDTWRLIPVQQYVATLPKATPADREDDREPRHVRVARVKAPRRTYVVGETYGRLRLLSSRPTNWAGGMLHTSECIKCGKSRDYTGHQLYIAAQRNHGCGCRNRTPAISGSSDSENERGKVAS